MATAYYSFTSWTGLSEPVWVGLDNYRQQFSDPRFLAALWHAAFLLVFFSVIPICLGLLLAALLSRTALPGMGFFRTVLFLPQVIPLVAIGYAWKWLYAPEGAVNQALRAVGLESLARPWLGDLQWALPAVGVVGAWITAGFCMVLFLSGIARIDQSLYDAARVDGAGRIREFFAVTLPGIRGELVIALAQSRSSAACAASTWCSSPPVAVLSTQPRCRRCGCTSWPSTSQSSGRARPSP